MCLPSKTKDIKVKVFKFNSIINAIVQCAIKIKNGKTCQCDCKKYCTCEKEYSSSSSMCICENGKYLKSIADDSKIVCDEIIYVVDIKSANVTNTIPTNVTGTVSSDFHKKIKYEIDCYILQHSFISDHILHLIIIISCYQYAKRRPKLKKTHCCTNNIKMEIMNFKKFVLNIL